MCIGLIKKNENPAAVALPKSNCFGLSITRRPSLRRKKIWQLERRFHCSIAGTCFTLDELRRFCRKSQGKPKIPVSDYTLHISFVGIVGDASEGRPANKYLDRKYQETIRRFDQANSADELRKLWNNAVSQGDVASAFWALVTHPLASEDLLFSVYGEVHMLSHLSGASVRLDMQALTQLRQRTCELERTLKQTRSERLVALRKKDQVIEGLHQRLDQALKNEKKYQDMEKKRQLLEGDEIVTHLRERLEEQANKLITEGVRADRAEASAAEKNRCVQNYHSQNQCLEKQLLKITAERDALENTLENVLSTEPMPCEKSGSCDQRVDLHGRCILYVGGRNRLCAHFRTLIEQQNGHFIHHDGGREESTQRLDALLTKVDAVLCPLDCVSHDAVNRIKRDCKRYGKHLTLLPQSSLSAFTKGVYDLPEMVS